MRTLSRVCGWGLRQPVGADLGTHELVRAAHDQGRAPKVVSQGVSARAGVAIAEAQDVLHVGAAPSVDALVVVADDRERLAPGSERPNQLFLKGVRVLILVNEKVANAADGRKRRRIIGLQTIDDQPDHRREVDVVRPVQQVLESGQHLAEIRVVRRDIIEVQPLVVQVRPGVGQRGDLGKEARFPAPEALDPQRRVAGNEEQVQAVLIENVELAVARVDTHEHFAAEPVDRPDADLSDLRRRPARPRQRGGDALLNRVRGLLGERERDDRGGVGSACDQPRNPVGQRPGLAGSRTRDDEDVRTLVRRRGALFVRKVLPQNVVDVRGTSHSAAPAAVLRMRRSMRACAATNPGGIALPTISAAAYLPRRSETR